MDPNNPYASPVGEEANSVPGELPSGSLPGVFGGQLVEEVPIPPGAISVEFHLVREDFVIWLQHWKSQNASSSLIGSPTLGLLLVLLVIVLVSGFLSGGWLVAGPLAGVIAGLLILWVGAKQSVAWNDAQYPGGMNFNQPDLALTLWHRVTLLPEYLILSTGLEQTVYRWRRFAEVQTTEQAIYLIENQLATHVIPRRAFASDVEFDQFVETARRYQQLAKPVADCDIVANA